MPIEHSASPVDALTNGKDVVADKPGCVALEQLDEIEKAVAQSGRFWSVTFSERFEVRCAIKAGQLVREGRIGRVVQTIGLGPHREGDRAHLAGGAGRPEWFYDRDRTGGIITDIASHQIDQFLWFTGANAAEVVSSTVANYTHPESPKMQDFGEVTLQQRRCSWLRPRRLVHPARPFRPGETVGCVILGTEGYLELRKYVDLAGRPGRDHLFVVDGARIEHIDCSDVALELLPGLGARRDQPHRDSLPPEAHVRGDAARDPRPAKRDDAGVCQVNGPTGKELRVGIVGCGTIARAHALSYQNNARVELVGVVDLDQGRADAFAARYGTTAYGSCRELLNEQPDLVSVATPPGNHTEVAVELLESGCSVLLEKPPATSLADMDVIAAAEKLSLGSVYVVFQHRHGSGARRAHHLLQSGALGTPRVVVCETLWYRPDSYFLPEWRGNWAGEGGGPTLGHGIHQIDLLLHLMGPWETVDARAARIARPVGSRTSRHDQARNRAPHHRDRPSPRGLGASDEYRYSGTLKMTASTATAIPTGRRHRAECRTLPVADAGSGQRQRHREASDGRMTTHRSASADLPRPPRADR